MGERPPAEYRELEPGLRWLVWRNDGRTPRAVAAFADREHAEWACALLRERHRHEPAAYLLADLETHHGGALLAVLAFERSAAVRGVTAAGGST